MQRTYLHIDLLVSVDIDYIYRFLYQIPLLLYCISEVNSLTANDELFRHENLTFSWIWTLRGLPRNFVTHASLCNTLPSDKRPNFQKQ